MSILSSNGAGLTTERILVKFFEKAHKAWKKGDQKKDRIGQELKEGDYVLLMDDVMLYSGKNFNLGFITGFTNSKVKVKRASYQAISKSLFESYEMSELSHYSDHRETYINGSLLIKLSEEQVLNFIKND